MRGLFLADMPIVTSKRKIGRKSPRREKRSLKVRRPIALILVLLAIAAFVAWRGARHPAIVRTETAPPVPKGSTSTPRHTAAMQKEAAPRQGSGFVPNDDLPPPAESLDDSLAPVAVRNATPDTEGATTAAPSQEPPKREKPRRIFSSTTEQVISGFANTRPGYPPPPTIRLPMGEDVASILDTPIEITDEDDERAVEIKENCARLKEEMRQFIAEGGTAENYLVQLHNELSKDYEDWKASQMYIVRLLQEGALEEARQYADEANADLSARGIRKVKLPENLVRKIEEGQ